MQWMPQLPPKVFAMSPWNAKSLPPSPHKSRTNNPHHKLILPLNPNPWHPHTVMDSRFHSARACIFQVQQTMSWVFESQSNVPKDTKSYIMQLTLFLHSRAQVAAGREKVVKSNLEGSRKRINQQKGGPWSLELTNKISSSKIMRLLKNIS